MSEKKDTRYEIEAELRTVNKRSRMALTLIEESNEAQRDPSEDAMLVLAVAFVAEHAKEAARLLKAYRLP